MSSGGDKVFEDAMSDVAPLRREPRVDVDRNAGRDRDSSLEHRRQAATAAPKSDRNPLSGTAIAPLDPWFVLEFMRPGVQHGVFRKLKQGRYEVQSRLDMHRMSVDTARRELFEFVEECYRLGLRCVLVIHGKGDSRPERERSSILKGCVDHWLRELEPVLAFHSAQPPHGGTGAAYVLLRKSEEQKRENRERFSKGRIPYDADPRN